LRRRAVVWLALALAAALAILVIPAALFGTATIKTETEFIVPSGASIAAVGQKLEDEGLITSGRGFALRARLLGGARPIQTGEYRLTPDMGLGDILKAFQSGKVVRRFITIPEGMPSIMVYERLMAEPLLSGEIEVPPEGSVLPGTYDFVRGESRQKLLERMQSAMDRYLAEAWARRGKDIAVSTMREALILASIVEKETGKPSERRMVAGLYSNRLKRGMLLQADPTIIYPITRGKPLGRRIRQSEIAAINGYNTYTRVGLPEGPITNPGRESIDAVLHPAKTDALYMVADGTGGHVFASSLEEHNANVARWYALRRERGEM